MSGAERWVTKSGLPGYHPPASVPLDVVRLLGRADVAQWLAQVKREAAAEALRDLADDLPEWRVSIKTLLTDRAESLAGGEQNTLAQRVARLADDWEASYGRSVADCISDLRGLLGDGGER